MAHQVTEAVSLRTRYSLLSLAKQKTKENPYRSSRVALKVKRPVEYYPELTTIFQAYWKIKDVRSNVYADRSFIHI